MLKTTLLALLLLSGGCSTLPKDRPSLVGPTTPDPTTIRTRLVVHYKEGQPIVDLSEIDKWFQLATTSLRPLSIKFKVVKAVFLEYDDNLTFEDVRDNADLTTDTLSVYVLDETLEQAKNKLYENMCGMSPMAEFGTYANYIILMPHRRGFGEWVFTHEVGHILGNLEHTFMGNPITGEIEGDKDCPDVRVTDNPFYCNIMNYSICKERSFTYDQLVKFNYSLHQFQKEKIINENNQN